MEPITMLDFISHRVMPPWANEAPTRPRTHTLTAMQIPRRGPSNARSVAAHSFDETYCFAMIAQFTRKMAVCRCRATTRGGIPVPRLHPMEARPRYQNWMKPR